ncbi:MAG: hypothetical protein ACKVQJ_04830 [Pyrinomonadaceae bacterium]
MSEHFISSEQTEGDLLTAAAFLAERIKSADGHAEAMKTIIPIFLSKGRVDLAAELANEVGEPYSRDKLLTLVAEKCAEADDDEYAIQLAEAIEDQGMQAQAFEQIALIKAAKGQIEKAREIANTMVLPDFVLGSIAVKQSASGDEAASLRTLDEISFPTARATALQQIATTKIESGDTAKSAEMLDLAGISANEIEHDEEKIRTLCDIGNLFIEAKRSDKAIETFDAARALTDALDNVHRDFFFVNCALGFLYAGSTDLADRTLDQVIDKTQMASALLGFARDYWKKDQKEDAVEALGEAHEILKSQRDSETRDSRARNALVTSIAVQFAGFGKTDKAIEIARENQDPDEEMSALSQIAQILTIQKEDELARKTLELIREDANRLFAFISVADAKEKGGESASAIALLDDAASLALTVPQLASRANGLNELAMRFAEHGKQDRARELSLESLDVIAEIKDESSQAAALAGLAGVYDETGLDLEDAERDRIRALLLRVQ